MACVNISGRLYPPELFWNMTEADDSSELFSNLSMLDVFSGASTAGNGLWNSGLNFSARPNEIPGIVCMSNPEQMLERWEIKKNLAMLISYSVIFVIGVLGNVTAMLVKIVSFIIYNISCRVSTIRWGVRDAIFLERAGIMQFVFILFSAGHDRRP